MVFLDYAINIKTNLYHIQDPWSTKNDFNHKCKEVIDQHIVFAKFNRVLSEESKQVHIESNENIFVSSEDFLVTSYVRGKCINDAYSLSSSIQYLNFVTSIYII